MNTAIVPARMSAECPYCDEPAYVGMLKGKLALVPGEHCQHAVTVGEDGKRLEVMFAE